MMKVPFEKSRLGSDAGAVRAGVPSAARCVVMAGLVAIGCGLSASGQDTNGSAPSDYSSFRIIAERNIFNAGRSGGSMIRNEGPRYEPKVDSFTLVGTMNYEKGPFAFFDGTSSDYRKVLPPGGTIAGYKVAGIGVNQVKLEAETNHVELAVGMQLRREDEGPWQLRESAGPSFVGTSSRSDFGRPDFGRSDNGRSDSRRSGYRGSDSRRSDYRRSDSRGSSFGSSGRSSPTPAASTPPLSADEESAILKKLMEQREKELK